MSSSKVTRMNDMLNSRRRFLGVAGASTASTLLGACSSNSNGTSADPGSSTSGVATTPPTLNGADCVLTPTAIEGPFYRDLNLVRQNITDGKPGVPLTMKFTVVDATTCQPIPNAIVDIWHADAGGLYSAFVEQGDNGDIDTTSESFLRGEQNTDQNGEASFVSIYPGWYSGRTTHIHLKVVVDDRSLVTTQLFFPDDRSTEVYETNAYATRGAKDTSNGADTFGGNVGSLLMTLNRSGDGYSATHGIGINQS